MRNHHSHNSSSNLWFAAWNGKGWGALDNLCVATPLYLGRIAYPARLRWFAASEDNFLPLLTAVAQEGSAWQVNNASGEHFMADVTGDGIAPVSHSRLCTLHSLRFHSPIALKSIERFVPRPSIND